MSSYKLLTLVAILISLILPSFETSPSSSENIESSQYKPIYNPENSNYNQFLLNTLYRNYVSNNQPMNTPYKRAAHKLEARSINQFKNCYFSPVQCVLLERRRR